MSQYYRELGERSKDHPNRKKGTAKTGQARLLEADPKRAREIAIMGGKAGKRGRAKETKKT